MVGLASGLGGVGKAAGSAVAAPIKQAAKSVSDTLKERYQAGARAVFTATGGSSTMGSAGEPAGDAASAADGASSLPAWARRMRRGQAMSHGVSAAAQAVRSGDSAGGGHTVDLSGRE
jgi:type IV secretion system protein TrbL